MEFIIPGLITLGAGAFRGVTGFGYALIVALGFAGHLSGDQMVPLIILCDLTLTLLILMDRRHGAVDWPVARLLLVAGAVGAMVGGLVSGLLDETTTRVLVAAVVCVAAIIAMIHHPPAWLAHRLWGLVAGVFVGILLAAFAVGGPLVAAWLLAGGTRHDRVRGTLAVFFGAVDLFSLLSRAAFGHVSSDLWIWLLPVLPLTWLGYAVGQWIGPRLEPLAWRRVSAIGLLVIAVAGGAQAASGLLMP